VVVEAEGQMGFPMVIRRESVDTVFHMIGRGEHSLGRLAEVLGARRLRVKGQDLNQLLNVNTPQGAEEFRREVSSRKPRTDGR
jgi:molybdopterin-guanine dinucleotide biosynthesis protein A